ncbi:MAG: hypothetical protein HN337_02780 [Deltaproteobacteria bacterium]|jgi:dTDP-4-amino-4,6-dideoxygalactose transaminase|nr:hypothetical protein [Deltaproteobacteria bacterium]
MKKNYTMFHPDITAGTGGRKDLIDNLLTSDCDEGGGEIVSLTSLLCDNDKLPFISYHQIGDGIISDLSGRFAEYIGEMQENPSEFVQQYVKCEGIDDIESHVAGLASATGALYLSLKDADVAGGDVITTSLNYMGVVNAIVMAGAKPCFVDIDPNNWSMDPKALEKAITKNTKAVILTHLNNYVDLEPFYKIFQNRGLDIPLIQDASLAIGSRCNGLRPGMINIGNGGTTVFSLATSKILTGLGGAMITSSDNSQMKRIVAGAYQGMSLVNPGAIESFGSNFKMNEINAVIAIEQLKRRDEIFQKRRDLKTVYDEQLSKLVKSKKIQLQGIDDDAVITHYGVRIQNRNELAGTLFKKYSIQLGMWHTYHNQAVYVEKYGPCNKGLPETDNLSDSVTYLPFHTDLSESDIVFICNSLKEELK